MAKKRKARTRARKAPAKKKAARAPRVGAARGGAPRQHSEEMLVRSFYLPRRIVQRIQDHATSRSLNASRALTELLDAGGSRSPGTGPSPSS